MKIKFKGQVWSTDFVISIMIFLIALGLIIFSWNYITYNTEEQNVINELESSALEITDVLVRSRGLPPEWSPSNVQSIGLADSENILNVTKVDYFMALDYEKAKTLLGIKGYEFYFEARDINGDLMKNHAGTNITKGIVPSSASIIVPVERYALYGEDIVKLKFEFWSMQI